MFTTNRPSTEYRIEPRSLYPVGYAILILVVTLGLAATFSAHSLISSYRIAKPNLSILPAR